jgi:hypothetical protein
VLLSGSACLVALEYIDHGSGLLKGQFAFEHAFSKPMFNGLEVLGDREPKWEYGYGEK